MTQSIDSLYISLGLSLSELETDFIAAERTVNENIRRLSRESELIRLRSQVEIAGLDETADAEEILRVRTDALNQQMAIQRDRVRILTAEYQSLVAAHGENSAMSQRAALSLERERLTLANLERELRGLSDTSGETNDLLGELSDLLPAMPTKLQALELAFGTVTAGIGAAATATKDLLDEFRELQNQSYELNMSFPDTRKFLREMRLAGGDIGDYEGYIRGITDAWTKGEWDDPEFIALRKYGAEITDATGRLKEFKDISEEVYQAWLKADAAGEGIEFLQLTGGEAGVRDAIQYFQRLKEAREDADKIFKAEIDDSQLHKLDRAFNLTSEQAGELKTAFGNIFVPAAQAAGEKFFQIFHDGTEYLVENKDALQTWGYATVETFDTIADKLREITSYQTPDTGDEKVDKMLDSLQWQQSFFNDQALWGDNSQWGRIFSQLPRDAFGDIWTRAAEKQKKFKDELENINAASVKIAKILAQFKDELENTDSVSGKVAKGIAALSKTQKENGEILSQYGIQRVKQFRDELEDLRIEFDFGDDEYGKALAQLDLWRQRELTDKLSVSNAEREAIEELYAAKLEQIEQEHADKIAQALQEHFENTADIEFSLTHSAFEKQLRDIELWKEAQKEKAETAEEVQAIIAEAAAKEARAFEQEVDRIKNLTQSLEDEIFEMENSQYEADKRRALQKAQRALDEGVDFAIVQRFLQDKFGQLDRRAAESRKSGSDYTKPPEGAMQSGGNGIMVIGGDQIVDDGLIRGQQQQIGLLVDENRLRAQLAPKLSQEARDKVAAIQATKELTAAQKELLQTQQSAASGFQFIEGDKVTNLPTIDYPQIDGDQFVTPAQELQEFSEALQQTTADIDPLKDSAKSAADVQKEFAEKAKDFPPEYFKNLADGTKAVSEMQLQLTKSTMELIDAQGKLSDMLVNLSKMPQGTETNQQSDGMTSLSNSTHGVRQAQDLLARTSRETAASLRDISDIPPQARIAQKDEGLKFGFDMDAAGLVAGLASLGLMGATAPISAPVIGGVAVASLLTGLAKGTYDETSAAKEQYDARLNQVSHDTNLSAIETALSTIDEKNQSILQKMPEPMPEINFDNIITPLNAIDEKVQSILQNMQSEAETNEDDRLQEIFGTLPNIEEYTKSILLELQSMNEVANATADETPTAEMVDYLTPLSSIDTNVQSILQQFQSLPALDANVQSPEITVSFETVVTPLNNIHSLLGNILTALTNQQPPQINVTPNNNINLGGAYVFDNAMKNQLVNDITSIIVDKITVAVQQATSRSSYGYSA